MKLRYWVTISMVSNSEPSSEFLGLPNSSLWKTAQGVGLPWPAESFAVCLATWWFQLAIAVFPAADFRALLRWGTFFTLQHFQLLN